MQWHVLIACVCGEWLLAIEMVIRTLIRHVGCHFERLDRHSNSGMPATVCSTALLACLQLYVRQHCWHVCNCMSDSIAGVSATACPTQRLCLSATLCPARHCCHVCHRMSYTDRIAGMSATVCPTQHCWHVYDSMSDTALLVCLHLYVRHRIAGMSATVGPTYCIAGMSATVCPTQRRWHASNSVCPTQKRKFVARNVTQAESTWSLLEPECQVSSGDCHSTKRSHSCHTATTDCDTRTITSELSLQSWQSHQNCRTSTDCHTKQTVTSKLCAPVVCLHESCYTRRCMICPMP